MASGVDAVASGLASLACGCEHDEDAAATTTATSIHLVVATTASRSNFCRISPSARSVGPYAIRERKVRAANQIASGARSEIGAIDCPGSTSTC